MLTLREMIYLIISDIQEESETDIDMNTYKLIVFKFLSEIVDFDVFVENYLHNDFIKSNIVRTLANFDTNRHRLETIEVKLTLENINNILDLGI